MPALTSRQQVSTEERNLLLYMYCMRYALSGSAVADHSLQGTRYSTDSYSASFERPGDKTAYFAHYGL